MKSIFLFLFALIGIQSLQAKGLNFIVENYMEIKDGLVSSSRDKVTTSAASFLSQIDSFKTESLTSKEKKVYNKVKSDLISSLTSIKKAKNIADQRKTFADLSDAIKKLMSEIKHVDRIVYRFYCPMKMELWFSYSKEVKNPYFGQQMLNCGSLEETYQ